MMPLDSISATLTALAVGRAVTLGLLDVDTPIAAYGVKTKRVGKALEWFKLLTTKHLLAQCSGRGEEKPGRDFTPDSGEYIDLLSTVLARVTGDKPVSWIRRHLLEPMGM